MLLINFTSDNSEQSRWLFGIHACIIISDLCTPKGGYCVAHFWRPPRNSFAHLELLGNICRGNYSPGELWICHGGKNGSSNSDNGSIDFQSRWVLQQDEMCMNVQCHLRFISPSPILVAMQWLHLIILERVIFQAFLKKEGLEMKSLIPRVQSSNSSFKPD